MPESVLITGGCGFVGSRVALRLRQAWPDTRLTCLDNFHRTGSELNVAPLRAAGCEVVTGDVRDPATLPAGPFEFLIECSAEPSVLAGYDGSPDFVYHTNLTGCYHCLEAARRWQSRFLFLSTSRVYPIAPLEAHPWHETDTRFEWDDLPGAAISSQGVTEALPMAGTRSLYGFTKYAAELLIAEYQAMFGLGTVVNRCGVIAGPGQFGKVDQGVVALWVMRHHARQPLRYTGYGGSGKQVRDVLHVDDLADLITEQVARFPEWNGWSGNVSGGRDRSVSLQELTALCAEVTGQRVDITPDPAPRQADLRLFIGDSGRLAREHGWTPQRSVATVVADVHDWVRREEPALKRLALL